MGKMTWKEVERDISKNHNHSWYDEIYLRNKNNLDKTAIFFRGTKISYREFFDMVDSYAKALKAKGINKGDEFVACLRLTPQYPALVAAASKVGAKINLISAEFNPDYIGKIIDNADAKFCLVDDWDLEKMAPVIKKRMKDLETIILPVDYWAKIENPYKVITDKFYKFDEEKFKTILSELDNVISEREFIENGKSYTGETNGHGKLQDDLAITYTSGSTSKGVHKGIVQKNRTYIIMGRYHDPEVANIPSMKNIVTMVAVGPHADTTLMTGVSDTFMQGGTYALDPIIDEEYFLYSLIINKPRLVIGTRTYWMRAMKQTYEESQFKNLKLPYLYVPSEGGEPLSAGEEKALNKWLKDTKAGTAITHTPTSIVKMTVGGGDSEHGSLFLSLYRDYKNKLQKIRSINEPIGLEYYNFVDLGVLREDGTYCEPMEMGRLVANSPISMERYHNNPEATDRYFITDAYGKRWGDLGTYGYVDNYNNVYIKGRIFKDDPKIKQFQIADEILRDTKNIMSCEVIYFPEEDVYVAHIETQFHKPVNEEKALLAAEQRCFNKFGDELNNRLLFRLRSHDEGFPTLFTAKRNINELKEEGITEKCILPSKYYSKDKGKKLTLK